MELTSAASVEVEASWVEASRVEASWVEASWVEAVAADPPEPHPASARAGREESASRTSDRRERAFVLVSKAISFRHAKA